MDKKKLSNLIGFSVFGLLAFCILVVEGGRQLKAWSNRTRTLDILNQTTQGFAAGKLDVMHQWAKGEFKDAWGRTIEIGASDRKSIQMVSRGPDGLLGTSDDIQSEVYPLKVGPAIAADIVEQAKQTVADVKKKAEKGKVEGDGWHFEWHWGKK